MITGSDPVRAATEIYSVITVLRGGVECNSMKLRHAAKGSVSAP